LPGLTATELRLLSILATHLSMPEIAAQMFLSQHHQVAGNVGVPEAGASSRSQAVARCRELGLLER
jgi:hypothetical protein